MESTPFPEVALIPLTLAEFLSCHTAGSSPTLPAAAFVALMRSPRALATSFTALISTTCGTAAARVRGSYRGNRKWIWLELGLSGGYLRLKVLRSQAGCAQLHHISEAGDGGHRRLGGLCQLLLAPSCILHQDLGVLHQHLCSLQDSLPEGGPRLVRYPVPPASSGPTPPCLPEAPFPPHRWSAKVSAPSRLSVPAVANMMVVSRSAMMPDTALAAVMQAWVPRLPAWSAASTWETWEREVT